MAELKLNGMHQRFLLAVLEGKEPVEAVRVARDPLAKPVALKTLQNQAAKLMKDGRVQEALARARAHAAERAEITVLDLVDQLMETRALAHQLDPPQLSAAVAATMGAAKLLGLVIDRSEVVHKRAKPALLPTKELELSEDEWRRQFDPQANLTHNER